jgi:NADPH2:quinone reductase
MANAIQVSRPGGPEVLEFVEHDPGPAGAGQARVRVAVAGVNFIDIYIREGLYSRELPLILGVEGAGTIEAVGPEAGGFAPGDRVAWCSVLGGYSEVALVPTASLVRIPAAVSEEQAAAALLQGMTAHYLTHAMRPLRPGDWALVHAAAGGTGLLLVQMLKAAGVRVIGTCSTPQKADLAREAGADHVVVLSEREDFAAAVREQLGGAGVHIVYDGVGRSTFEGSLQCLRPRGWMVLFGQSSGPVPPFELQRLNALGSLVITRPSLGHFVATRAELEERSTAVLAAIASRTLRVRIGGRYPLEEAARAHRDLAGRSTTGKLLLVASD